MSMDIMGLQVPPAQIRRPENMPQSYKKIDGTKVKEMIGADLDTKAVDLLEASGKSPTTLAEVARHGNGSVGIISNYSTETFFRSEMPEVANADGTYTISGVRFTADELQHSKAVLQKAADSISAGPGRNSNLDYRNWAQMAIAEQAVDNYASANLRAEQQAVVSRAIRDYTDGLQEMQDRLLKTSDSPLSDYYGQTHTLTQTEADALNAIKTELSKITGHTYRPSHAGDSGGRDQIATNQELIGHIQNVFSAMDLSSSRSMSQAFAKYESLVRPAYMAQGISPADVSSVLANDTAQLRTGLDAILNAGRRSFDFGI